MTSIKAEPDPSPQIAEVRRSPPRLTRERRTARAMVRLYCLAHHGRRGLCADCEALAAYADQRLGACPFQEDKPPCLECPIHCYAPARRDQIRQVMRWAGPRMLWRHPVLAIRHLLDGRRFGRPR